MSGRVIALDGVRLLVGCGKSFSMPSNHAVNAFAFLTPFYIFRKGGIRYLFLAAALPTELSPKGIRVNCVAPGFIATDMSAKALNNDPERKAKALGRTPMGVLGQPADIGDAVAFLASDAAQYITGVVLPVDGGNTIGF